MFSTKKACGATPLHRERWLQLYLDRPQTCNRAGAFFLVSHVLFMVKYQPGCCSSRPPCPQHNRAASPFHKDILHKS